MILPAFEHCAPGFRRQVKVVTGVGCARAVVEDDFHHFRVEVLHEGGRITRVKAEALRFPWSACPMAMQELRLLHGVALVRASFLINAMADPRLQCTHMFDLAGLAAATAARGIPQRSFSLAVSDPVDGRSEAQLIEDSTTTMIWVVSRGAIEEPSDFEGVALGTGFTAWASRSLSVERAEAALVLRRAIFVSRGRTLNLDAYATAPPLGGCITLQPHRAAQALRVVRSSRDFQGSFEELTSTDKPWLEFEM